MRTTNGENERLAVVENEVKNVRDVVIRIEGKLDNLPTRERVDELEGKINDLRKRVDNYDTKTTWKLVVAYITTAVLLVTSALTLYELLRPKT